MSRCASSASSRWTEMRTSPRPLTLTGKIDCGRSDATIDGTPCASSSPRTMLASMSEWVRKMTTRSGDGGGDTLDLQQNHRHVVVLRRVADERLDLAENALAQLIGGQLDVFLEDLRKPRLAKAVVGGVHGFGDPVGEEQVEVARMQRQRLLDE